MRLFLFGGLRDPDLRRVVAGTDVPAAPTRLEGYQVRAVPEVPEPALVPAPGARAEGEVVELSGAALDRVEFHERCWGREPQPVELACGPARVYVATTLGETGEAWDMEAWRPVWARLAREAAREIMEYRGHAAPETVAARMRQILVRADSAARAATEGPPQEVRRGFTWADVEVVRHRRPYSEYYSVIEQDLRFRRFDGSWSDVVSRGALVTGDAVTLLPYDPVRDTVLLVEQFRFGPHARGDDAPWALEPIAGRLDPGETPQSTARREALEEAQLEVDRLERVGGYYASTGCMSEYVLSYVGLCDLGRFGGGVAGAEAEDEDILSHVLSFDELMGLVASGEAEDAPLLISAYWLAANRDRLRAGTA